MFNKLKPYLLFAVYQILQFTWRIRIIESKEVQQWVKENRSFIIAHWHGDELGILHLTRTYHVACIVSTSKDGDLMNKAVHLLGGETVRGSSTRGGAQALRGIIHLIRRGRRPSVAVDGPKGPIYEVKPGILHISKLTRLPIVPISFQASRFHIFTKAWNQSKLPLPFAKVTVLWGDPMQPVERDQDAKDPRLTLELKTRIDATKERAAALQKESRAFFKQI